MSDAQLFKFNCAACGGTLEVPVKTKIFTCSYCGVSQKVYEKSGNSKVAAELALQRLPGELQDLEQKRRVRGDYWNKTIADKEAEFSKNIAAESAGNSLGCVGCGCPALIAVFGMTFLVCAVIVGLISIPLEAMGIDVRSPNGNETIKAILGLLVLAICSLSAFYFTTPLIKWFNSSGLLKTQELTNQKQSTLEELNKQMKDELESLETEIEFIKEQIEENRNIVNS